MVNGLLSLSEALLEECGGLTLVMGVNCVQFESVRSWLLAKGLKRSELPENFVDKTTTRRCYEESSCVFVTPLALVGDLLRGTLPTTKRALVLRPNVDDQALVFAAKLLAERDVVVSAYFDDNKRGNAELVQMTEEMVCAESCLTSLLDACSSSLFKKGLLPHRPKSFQASTDASNLCAVIDSLETPAARREARYALREDLKDIAMLTRLLRRLYVDDALAFYLRLLCVQRDENHNPRNWMSCEYFDRLVTVAKKRLFDSSAPYDEGGTKVEDPPKRSFLNRALKRYSRRRVMVVVRDDLSAQQVVDWLAHDPGALAAQRVADALFQDREKNKIDSSHHHATTTQRCRGLVIMTQEQLRSQVDAVGDLTPDLVICLDDDVCDACDVENTNVVVERLAYRCRSRRRVATKDERRGRKREESEIASTTERRRRIRRRVVVDGRELRSRLPRALHEANFQVEIGVLPTADYVVSADCGIERKAVESGDLSQSLESGRLFNQLRVLSGAYELAVLLVEFREGCYPHSYLTDDLRLGSLHAKLAQIAMHFPTVRICWSPSPEASLDLFEAIAENRCPPPSVEDCLVVEKSREEGCGGGGGDPEEVLEKIPGCETESARRKLLEHVDCLKDVANLSLEKLREILGTQQQATLCHEFFHTDKR